jgi:hypothetical protein
MLDTSVTSTAGSRGEALVVAAPRQDFFEQSSVPGRRQTVAGDALFALAPLGGIAS